MNRFNYALAAAVAVIGFTAATPKAEAQVNIDIGAEPHALRLLRLRSLPLCSLRYYSPEWFVGGVFVGAGPWFHGPDHFRGHVDNRFRCPPRL